MMSSTHDNEFLKCLQLIKDDKLDAALCEVKNYGEWNQNRAGKCLVELHLLIYKAFSSQLSIVSSTPKDVFCLADYFCSIIKQHKYAYDLSNFIICIYYIVKYLLKKNYLLEAKQLCQYIIDSRSENPVLKQSDKTVLKYIYKLFIGALTDLDIQSLLDIEETDDDNSGDGVAPVMRSVINLWKFIFDFQKCDTEVSISDLIVVLSNFLVKFDMLHKNVVKYICNDGLKHIFSSLMDKTSIIISTNVDAAFINLLRLLSTSVLSLIKLKQFSELPGILNSIESACLLFNNDNQKKGLTFFKHILHLLYFLSVPPLKRDFNHANINIDGLLKNVSVILKELSAMKSDIFRACYLLIIRSLKGIKFWLKDCGEEVNFTEKTFSCLMKFIFEVYDLIKLSESKLQSDKHCHWNKSDAFEAISLLRFIVVLFSASSKHDNLKKMPKIYFKYAERVQQECVPLLKLLLKDNSCKECSYTLSTGFAMYDVYLKLELYDQCATLTKQLCFFLISCSAADVIKMSKMCHVLNALMSYCHCCNKLGKSLDGLTAITAFSLSESYNSNNQLIGFWTLVKFSRHCSSDLMGLTVCDVAREQTESLVSEWGISKSTLINADWSSFLLQEIRAYHKSSSLQGEAFRNAFNLFMSMKPAASTVNVAEALIYHMESSLKEAINLKLDIKTEPEFHSFYKKLINKKNKSVVELCVFGNMLHTKVRCDIFSKRMCIENMLNVCKVKKSTYELDKETGLVIDSSDSCQADVLEPTTSFFNQEKLMKLLDCGVKCIKEALIQQVESPSLDLGSSHYQPINYLIENNDSNVESSLSTDLILLSLNNIECAAQLYSLHCEDKRAADTWHLLYDLCHVTHPHIALNAVSCLLDLSSSVNDREDLFNKAASLGYASVLSYVPSKNLDLSSSSEVEIMFFAQLAKHYLLDTSKNMVECAYILTKINENFDFKIKIPYIHFLRILTEFLAVPGSTSLWKGSLRDIFTTINEATISLQHVLQQNKWSSYSEFFGMNRLLLEMKLVAGHSFYVTDYPRETYYYLKRGLTVAQKFAASSWTCRLLVSLCWMDISALKLSDCKLKLRSLEAILGLKSLIVQSRSPDHTLAQSSLKASRSQRKYHIASDDHGSPIIQKHETVGYYVGDSDFINPVNACIFVDFITLKAVLSYNKKEFNEAANWFDYGFKMVHNFEQSDSQELSNYLSIRKAALLHHRASLFHQSGNNSNALDYFEKSSQLYNETYGRKLLHPFKINPFNFNELLITYKNQPSFMCQSTKIDCLKNQMTLSLTSSKNDLQTPPRIQPKIPEIKTPLMDSAKKNNQAFSPGDVPSGSVACRMRLFSDKSNESDDNSDENKPVIGDTGKKTVSNFKVPTFRNKPRVLTSNENSDIKTPTNEGARKKPVSKKKVRSVGNKPLARNLR